MSLGYIILLSISIIDISLLSEIKNQRYYKVSSTKLGIIPLNNVTKLKSVLECSFKCLSNVSNCRHFLYYKENQTCLLGTDLGSGGRKPPAGQHIYSIWPQYCDVSLGYNSTIMKMYGQCLYVSKTEETFSMARNECNNKQGQLVLVKTDSKRLIVLDLMNSFSISECWIGLDDLQTEGVWVWSDGAVVTTTEMRIAFCSVQPDSYQDDEDCGEMMSYYKCGNDVSCSFLRSYMCEYVP